MLALVCDQPPRLVTDHPEPVRAPGEALIAVHVAGICDTDLQLARGYMGYRGVLGHEWVGHVIEADDRSWIGRRVVADINAGCGACDECRFHLGHHCASRTVLGIVGRDGALAERLVMPLRCLVPVPDRVSDAHAVFAEPIAAALHVLDDVPASADPVVVLGDGKLGLLIALTLHGAGRRVLLVGHHRDKLERAAAVGIDTRLEHELDAQLVQTQAVVEATGHATGIARALSMLSPRGTLILKTTVAGPTSVDLSPIVIHELRVVGSRCGDMSRAMAWLAQGNVDLSSLIGARYPLSQAVTAFEHAARKGVLKVLVEG